MARGRDQRRRGWGDWVQPSGPVGSPCEHLDQSDLSLGLGHSPETMEPAHRKRPHLWVQGSELILILAGGRFSPQRQLQFCRSQWVTIIIQGDYIFNHYLIYCKYESGDTKTSEININSFFIVIAAAVQGSQKHGLVLGGGSLIRKITNPREVRNQTKMIK